MILTLHTTERWVLSGREVAPASSRHPGPPGWWRYSGPSRRDRGSRSLRSATFRSACAERKLSAKFKLGQPRNMSLDAAQSIYVILSCFPAASAARTSIETEGVIL